MIRFIHLGRRDNNGRDNSGRDKNKPLFAAHPKTKLFPRYLTPIRLSRGPAGPPSFRLGGTVAHPPAGFGCSLFTAAGGRTQPPPYFLPHFSCRLGSRRHCTLVVAVWSGEAWLEGGPLFRRRRNEGGPCERRARTRSKGSRARKFPLSCTLWKASVEGAL